MKLSNFIYPLPQELIAQHSLEDRAAARLLVLERKTKRIIHRTFQDIVHYLTKGDVLVINNTRVFKARLLGRKATGGKIEILLVREQKPGVWEALITPARKVREEMKILFDDTTYAIVTARKGNRCRLTFNVPVESVIRNHGCVPLPHYIKRDATARDEVSYQTVFADKEGSIAAPTAGLHFTNELLRKIRGQGAVIAKITLHIGPGTFKPITADNIENHIMESEFFEIPSRTINQMKNARRIFAVGTSVCRSLETYVRTGRLNGSADLFIFPGYAFKMIDSLITNFHQPCSTPLLLVSAFAEKDLIFKAYAEAIRLRYRFLSYGDAMLIL